METLDFLCRILPATGLYVVARLVNGSWRHQVCDSLEEAAQYTAAFDAQGVPTYHACAAYRERSVEGVKDGKPIKQVRTHKNVRALKAFFMDLDVKPGVATAFESQEGAVDALVAFCNDSGLPIPMVISSGGGIHAYWTLTEEIGPDAWKQTAAALKALAHQLNFKADPACTGDPARVLRSVGTFNRKNPANVRPVELIADADPLGFPEFSERIQRAMARYHVRPPETVKSRETKSEKLNEAFAIRQDFPPCSAKKVADRCAQLARMRDTRGNISEPHWYAGIQLMSHAIEGDELIHQWSDGYAAYSAEETSRKIAQIRSQALGPTLCTTFEGRNPGGCDGCPFKGKISSPAQLGAEIKSAPPPVVEAPAAPLPESPLQPGLPPQQRAEPVALPNPPAPYTRRAAEEGGGIFVEEDGILHKIYEYDCYPTDITFDESVGYEVMRVRHWLPQEGWMEHPIQSSLLARPADFDGALRDVHIQPLIKNRMVMYMDAYLRELRKATKVRRLFRSMGWKDDGTKFVLGERLYAPGEIITTGSSARAAGFLGGFRARGDLAPWRDLTSIFSTPGFEPHAFMLLTAFAAPLLELGGRDGFTVSALGETNAGKSTMGTFLASVYGSPKETWLGRLATANARIERLGSYNSIPCYMDEITTIEPKDLREIIYMIPTGKGKDALNRNRESREGAKWQTILVVSTNDPLHGKLQEEKTNPEAESMRLFEFEFPANPAFQSVAGLIHSTLATNYGVAGGEYIRQLVEHQARLRREIPLAITELEREFQMEGRERFWSQAAALALLGGKLAQEWGLIDFDPEVIRPWLLAETRRMRHEVATSTVTATTVIGEYLDAHVGERLVVTKLNAGMSASNARPTRGALSQRYEKDIETLWVTRSHILHWLRQRHHNPNSIKKELVTKGILLNGDDRKILGAGTDLSGGQQVPCWKLRADCPELTAVLTKEIV